MKYYILLIKSEIFDWYLERANQNRKSLMNIVRNFKKRNHIGKFKYKIIKQEILKTASNKDYTNKEDKIFK